MILRIKRLSAEFAWICLGQLMAVAAGAFGVRLLTYKLSPSIYGDLAIGVTIAVLAQQVILVPLGSGFLRFFSGAHEEGKLYIYIKAIKLLLIKATVLITAVSVIFIIALFLLGYTKWIILFSLAFLYSLASGYNIILDYIQNAARQRKVVALHQAAGQWLHFFIPVGLISLWGGYSWIVMLGYIVAALLILSSQLLFFRNKIISLAFITERAEASPDALNRYTRQILLYVWPFATWGLFTWLQVVSSRWALLSFTDSGQVGLYSILYQFGCYPVIILSGLTFQMVSPVYFSRAGSGNDSRRVAKTITLNNYLFLIAVIATLAAVALSWVFHNEIFAFLAAPEYRSVSWLLPLLVLSGGLFSIGQVINMTFFVKTDTRILIYPKIVSAVFGVVLNYLGAYFYGLIGVALAGIVFPLMYLVWILILYSTKIGLQKNEYIAN
jgi:O-antigen/teichoic acid export membrane protein